MSQQRNNPQQQSLATRGQQSQQGLTRQVTGTLTRLPNRGSITTTDYQVAADLIEEAYDIGANVVAPGSPTIMPEGYGVVVTRIDVRDFDKYGDDLYPIQGSPKLGLHKGILDDIGRGYGLDWPPEWTFVEPYPEGDPRNNDPFCIKITVCGRYKDYDGGWKTLPPQTKDIDLREGSAEVEQIRTRHAYNETKELPKDATPEAKERCLEIARRKADAELAQNRKFLRSYAQTKARLMVIGTIVRRAYTLEQLKKGFFCVKVVQTWQSKDPVYKKAFADAIVKRELESSAVLYGQREQPKALPPVSDAPYNADAEMVAYEEALAESGVTDPETPSGSTQAATQQQQCTPDACYGKGAAHVKACYETAPSPATQPATTAPAGEPWVITDGPMKGIPVTDQRVTNDHLESLLDLFTSHLEGSGDLGEDDVSRIKAKRRHVEAELTRRGVLQP